MNDKINEIAIKLKNSWDSMDIEVLNEVQALVGELAKAGLDKGRDYSSSGIKLYSDNLGFMFYAYSEINGTYRTPHNHGNGWVIYTVVEGAVEMGTYINWEKTNGQSQLILKDRKILESGDARIYYPGEIHDTKCLSKDALILRLTSCDLKVEDIAGRMKRFNSLKDA